ncbi:MAG: DUF2189 domain-containing protein [Alphaproteobacteria bacterium]|nr:DUF2189 domain-containing protein [Alphaproteobacteria bacterium]
MQNIATGPVVLPVAIGDILEILALGLRDFRTAPFFGLFVGGLYMAVGWILILLLIRFELPFLVYPLAAGFAFIAPFIATVCYAVSRTLERNEPLSCGAVRRAVWGAARRDLGWMALVTGFSLFIWMDIAALLFFGFLGLKALSAPELLQEIFTTPMGLLFLVIGNGVGAVIALAVFSFSVISFPMLFDRDTDFVTAMITSVRVVTTNPAAMIAWCVTIAILIGLSLLSGLVGLLVILPVLGHASWHLYRRAVSAAPTKE